MILSGELIYIPEKNKVRFFIDKNEREPNKSSMSEYGLMAKLKNFKANEAQKKILKPYDRHNLLGHVEIETPSIDDIIGCDLSFIYFAPDL